MNSQDLWTSKLGKTYQKDQVDFDTAAKELESIRNQPCNKRCADCGANGTVWSSVNLGVFTCMRCGSFHRALGTHISKPKGCTGTYLWSPDEVENMKRIGNSTADTIYGSSAAMKSLPPPDAPHNQWLEFFRDKYERRKWADTTTLPRSLAGLDQGPIVNEVEQQKVVTKDLLGLGEMNSASQFNRDSSSNDFFSQFNL